MFWKNANSEIEYLRASMEESSSLLAKSVESLQGPQALAAQVDLATAKARVDRGLVACDKFLGANAASYYCQKAATWTDGDTFRCDKHLP